MMHDCDTQVQTDAVTRPAPPQTDETVQRILADAHRDPKAFVESWEVPGGAE